EQLGSIMSSGVVCGPNADAEQPGASDYAMDSIPANYLELYQEAGEDRGVPWKTLAGIGQVESHHGSWYGPGIAEGHNDWRAAVALECGGLDSCAAGQGWGAGPIHQAEDSAEGDDGVDGNDDGIVTVCSLADVIAAAAAYLLKHGIEDDVWHTMYGYNHDWCY